MKRALGVLLCMVLVLAGSAARWKTPSLQGVWQVVEVTTGDSASRVIRHPQAGLLIVTEKYYSRTEEHAERPRPLLSNSATASADELRAAWGAFYGEAGTYAIDGKRITLRPTVAMNPSAMTPGAYAVNAYELSGNTLMVRMLTTEHGPVSTPVTIKLTRME